MLPRFCLVRDLQSQVRDVMPERIAGRTGQDQVRFQPVAGFGKG